MTANIPPDPRSPGLQAVTERSEVIAKPAQPQSQSLQLSIKPARLQSWTYDIRDDEDHHYATATISCLPGWHGAGGYEWELYLESDTNDDPFENKYADGNTPTWTATYEAIAKAAAEAFSYDGQTVNCSTGEVDQLVADTDYKAPTNTFPDSAITENERRLDQAKREAHELHPETGPWTIETNDEAQISGNNWWVCYAGVDPDHTPNKHIYVTTDRVHASETLQTSDMQTAEYFVWVRNHWPLILAALDAYDGPIPDLPIRSTGSELTVVGLIFGEENEEDWPNS